MDPFMTTAALNPPAPTDGGQPSSKMITNIISNDSMKSNSEAEISCTENPIPENTSMEMELLRRLEQSQDANYLPMMSLDTLMEKTFPVQEGVIEHLLYKGLYIFAGAPKIGKSFLVLQLAYAVSTGQAFCGYEVKRGAVLYLALEDQYQRLQRRMARMFGVEGQGDLLLAVSAKPIGQGLEGQMEFFLKQYPQARLIVIDTLQKVREGAGDGYSYASDYDLMAQLKTFADKHGIALLLVHHTRKQPSGDSFEMISGTTGLLGCADGAFLMHKEKRTDNQAILEIVGRDQPDQRLHLIRNVETLTWEVEKADCELWKEPPDPLLEQISQLVTPEQPVWKGSGAELLEALGLETTSSSLTRRLNVRMAQLYNTFGITYQNIRNRTGSHITLTLENQQM